MILFHEIGVRVAGVPTLASAILSMTTRRPLRGTVAGEA
jgi:hypothetical protein